MLTYCHSKGYDVSYRFSETYSGLSLERPDLDRLRELVKVEAVDVVVCYSIDRLSRDPTHGVILTQELERHGVKLEAVTEDVSNSELGRLITYIRGFASKLEAEKIRERTMRGKKAHLANGELPQGTGIGVYGYTWNKETKKREVNDFEAAVVRDIFERVATGNSIISVARGLNQHNVPTKAKKLWHSLTIRRMIKNTAYIGLTYFTGTLLPGVTPPIVDKELFEAANKQIVPKTGHPKHEYLLRNHLFCALCGKPMVGHCLNKKYRYYQCTNARPHENYKKLCPSRYVRAIDLEKIVWEQTRAVLADPSVVLSQLNSANEGKSIDAIENEINILQKHLRSYEKRRTQLLRAMEFEEFDSNEVLDRMNTLKRERVEDEAKLSELTRAKENMVSLADAQIKFSKLYERVLTNLENADFETKRLVLDALDIRVTAGPGAPVITGVIPLELALPTIGQTSA